MDEDQDEVENTAQEDEGPERYWRPLVEEENLRPMILAIGLSFMTVGGWALLLAVRDRQPIALMFDLLLAILSVEAIIRNRRKLGRLGIVSWSIITLWVGSALAAVAANMTGYL